MCILMYVICFSVMDSQLCRGICVIEVYVMHHMFWHQTMAADLP
jgi:hypothetical protein